MGGNLLQGRRIDRDEYNSVSTELLRLLKAYQLFVPKTVLEKDSFGDIDLLLKDSTQTESCIKYLESKGYEVINNGNTFSFLYKGIQVDILPSPKLGFDYFLNYYSWNDLGGLIGILTKQLKLSSGFLGLTYKHYNQNQFIDSITVSYNYNDTLELLKLSSAQYNQGFNTYVEMFEWLYASPYFNTESFALSHLNNKNRARNTKRKVYMMFLDWLETKPIKNFTTDIKTNDLFEMVQKVCPRFKHQYRVLELETNESAQFKAKFNGNIVKEITNLNGLELSAFMKDFRLVYPRPILGLLSPEEIYESIKSYYEDVFVEA